MRRITAFLTAAAMTAMSSAADDTIDSLRSQVDALMKAVEQLNQRIDALEDENEALKEQQQVIQQDVAAIPPPAPKLNQGFNPDIGVVFDTVGTLTEMEPEDFEEDEGFDRFSVREIELNIGHDIDPYARFDATITFSDFEEVDIESAYVTYSNLPLEIAGKAGRFRLPIGLSNPLHRDQLFSVDEPLVIQRYLGHEGLFRTGAELSRFLPQLSDHLTQQIRAGISEGGIGEEGTLFGESRQQPTYFARLTNEFEVSEAGTLNFGGSFLAGNSEDTNREVDVYAYGLDAQYRHRFGPFRTLTLQAEALFQDRDEPITQDAKDDPWGYYLLADYRLNQRWEFGGRYDWAEVANYDPFDPDEPFARDTEEAFSAWLTFHQSEFARWRLQYQHLEHFSGLDDDRLMLQGTFFIGWHQHSVK